MRLARRLVNFYILNDYRKKLNPMHFEKQIFSNDEPQFLERTFGFQASTLSRNLHSIEKYSFQQ